MNKEFTTAGPSRSLLSRAGVVRLECHQVGPGVVEADLHREGEASRQTCVHDAQRRVPPVVIVVQAFPQSRPQLQVLGLPVPEVSRPLAGLVAWSGVGRIRPVRYTGNGTHAVTARRVGSKEDELERVRHEA